jgi:nickel/cobalt transporter (NiCoT) family protein
MSGIGTLAVFVFGLRHGADPDHLAAIDNVTRNAHAAGQRNSRFVGVFFAAGHSAMVLALAVILSVVSSRVAARAQWLELLGTWVSIAILLAMAGINVAALLRNDMRPHGIKARLLPRVLREAQHPLAAVPIGMLFGLGFETSSQIAAYSVAFSRGGGAVAGLMVGLAFCAGMMVTDTFDSLLVHRIVAHRSGNMPRVMRLWLFTITALAIAVAAYEIAGLFGWRETAQSDLFFGIAMVAILTLTFVAVYFLVYKPSVRARERAVDVA